MKIKTIVCIGAGKVAQHLCSTLLQHEYKIVQIYSRTITSARKLAQQINTEYTNSIANLKQNADLYIICVSDNALLQIAENLTIEKGLIVHTAGSIDMTILSNCSKRYGVFYPLQTFSEQKTLNFKDIPICIEANTIEDYKILNNFAQTLANNVYQISSMQRKYIHTGAVFACNFVNHLFNIAYEILTQQKIPFQLLKPLVNETLQKAFLFQPKQVQTGPAIRNDTVVMQNQRQLIQNPLHAQIYDLISKSIIQSAKEQI